jgi:cell division septal protein FtsQ
MISAGRDLESCINDVSRWMKAASDIDQAEKQAKNPPLFKKLQGADTVQQQALQVYAAKKKLEAQRAELKQYLQMTYGPQSWADLIHLEGRIRKERQEMIYKQQEMRQKIVEVIAVVILVLLSLGVMGFIGTLLISKGN